MLGKIQNFNTLAYLCSWAGRFESYLVGNPEYRFSHDVAHMYEDQDMSRKPGLQMSRDMTNQQSECAPSEDSDQPGHLPSLIRVFAVCMKKPWVLSYPLSAQWRLIKLGRCPGWSESSLGAHSFCWFCHLVAHMCFFVCKLYHKKTLSKMSLCSDDYWSPKPYPLLILGKVLSFTWESWRHYSFLQHTAFLLHCFISFQ